MPHKARPIIGCSSEKLSIFPLEHKYLLVESSKWFPDPQYHTNYHTAEGRAFRNGVARGYRILGQVPGNVLL